jgi:hypothetical protein
MSERPGKAFAQLHNWQILDLNHICSRIKKNRLAKPRIEISAHITKMNNLSVRWHPGGRPEQLLVARSRAARQPLVTWAEEVRHRD